MIKLGLVGRDISHSQSQAMYESILGQEVDYHLLDFENAQEVESLDLIFKNKYLGISVTYPYKQHFNSQVSINDDVVKKLGAINCIRLRNLTYEATNTDYLAAKHLLKTEFFEFENFIILGSGNMAKVFEELLKNSDRELLLLSRKTHGDLNQVNYEDQVDRKDKKTLIINCCSRDFIFRQEIPKKSLFWDMNYNFKGHASFKSNSLNYLDGLNLLRWQAKFALDFWDIAQPRNS